MFAGGIVAHASGDILVNGFAYGGVDFGGGMLPTPGSELIDP